MISNSVMLFISGLGGWEVLLIVFVMLLLFGAKKIPELARGLGKGIQEFKHATNEIKNEVNRGMDDVPSQNTISNMNNANNNTSNKSNEA